MDLRRRIFSLLLLFTFVIETWAKVDYRQTARNKGFMGSMNDGEFEVVHPFQIRERNDRIGIDTRNYFLRGSEHYEQVTIVIRTAALGRLKIVASRNDHLIVNQTSFRKLDTNGEHVVGERVENCFYQGSIAGDPDSFAAFSSCNGLRGLLAFSNGSTYGVYPLDGGDRGKRHPHVLYKASWKAPATCGSTAAIGGQSDAASAKHKHRRDMAKQTKNIEVAAIGDYAFMAERGSDEMDGIMYIIEAVNAADLMLSRDLNVRLCLVYLELWMDVQRVDLVADSAASLAGLVDYSAGHLYSIAKDASVMFTGGSFVNDEALTATFRSICTARAASIVKAVDEFSPMWSGQLLAQATGHVLGLEHDSPSCACPNCIMNAKIAQVDSPFGWQFSKCSIARMHGVWQSGHVHCLLNAPFQESTLRSCGNGVVEGSEECDCGPRETCSDACCDPLTCTLRPNAQCAAHQQCCSRCQLLPPGSVCRPSAGHCDVVETCDGRHGDCPTDGHLVDGSACGEEGQCWRGNCSDAQMQCESLWGKGARVAEGACFDQNAKDRTDFANCGDKPCAESDVKCGILHCQGGESQPSIAGMKSGTFFFPYQGSNVQCKAVADPIGFVVDGSSCGPGRVCVGRSCVEMVQVSAPVTCPTNNVALACSGHGDCTTVGRCVCIEGWEGEACDSRSSIKKKAPSTPMMVPSLASGKSLDTGTLLLILLGVGLFLLLLLVCLLLCYRRRSSVEIPVTSDEKSIEAVPENQRAIKFGNMPSWREEKRKKRSNKRIYGALNRITEADERDTASLRSRESALMAEGYAGRGPMTSSRSEVGVNRADSSEHIYAASVIGIGRDERDIEYPIDFPNFPWRSERDNVEPGSPSLCSYRSGLGVITPGAGPLRLHSLRPLLRRLDQSDDEGSIPEPPRVRYPVDEDLAEMEAELEHAASNTESSRAGESPNQGGGSVDGANHHLPQFRHSPSLFSDPFRLEMGTSMNT